MGLCITISSLITLMLVDNSKDNNDLIKSRHFLVGFSILIMISIGAAIWIKLYGKINKTLFSN